MKKNSGYGLHVLVIASAFAVPSVLLWQHQAKAQSASPSLLVNNLSLRTVVSGLDQPISIAFTGPDEMLVLEKGSGQVKRVVSGVVQSVPAVDLAVNNSSERGLLGIALDPGFATNHFVYLYWTCIAPVPSDPTVPSLQQCPDAPSFGADSSDILAVPLLGNRLDRFVWNGSTLTYDRNLIKLHTFQNDGAPVPPGQGDQAQGPAGNHNGGVLRFGADGKLYLIYGDNGRRSRLQNLVFGPTSNPAGPAVPDDQFGGPEPDNAHFSGVVLRLNTDGSAPPDNPFFAAGAAMGGEVGSNIQKIFAYGIRNSFGMDLDPVSGSLWEQENGDDSFDEINRIEPGLNSGWVEIMGPVGRIAQFKAIETSAALFGLQQLRWSPVNIANTPAEGLSRLFQLPGSHFRDPDLSWKYALAPGGLGFLSGNALGVQYAGDLFMGLAVPLPVGGPLFHFDLTSDRNSIAVNDPRLLDRVADNLEKRDLTESEPFLIGRDFGTITDIRTGPNGNLYVVSLSKGAIYEIFRPAGTACGTDVSAGVSVTRSGFRFNSATQRFAQTLIVRNNSGAAVRGPVSVVLGNLSANADLYNRSGVTGCSLPAGQPFIDINTGPDNMLSPGESVTAVVEFTNAARAGITYTTRVLSAGDR